MNDKSQNSEQDVIRLPSWPTCRNCLSWLSEGIAVAVGETVHILRRNTTDNKTKGISKGKWRVETIRTNSFDHDEWPYESLAPIQDFSIGEEQSDSHVVALKWSYDGLGIHRRAVLAVLTSNLLLSIWESNGNTSSWRRTCIVNHYLVSNNASDRKRRRIRAFVWCPPVILGNNTKWGIHHVITASDDGTISVLQIKKQESNAFGTWNVTLKAQHRLMFELGSPHNAAASSVVAEYLQRTSSVTSLRATKFRSTGDQNREVSECSIIIIVTNGSGPLSMTKSLLVTFKNLLRESTQFDEEVEIQATDNTGTDMENDYPPEELFNKALIQPCSDFDAKFALRGKYRVRFWGTTYSGDKNELAACITLHPKDMIEYTTPSLETSLLVFADNPLENAEPQPMVDPDLIRLSVFEFIAKQSQSIEIVSDIDKRLVTVTSQCILQRYSEKSNLHDWVKQIQKEGVLEKDRSPSDTSPGDLASPEIQTALENSTNNRNQQTEEWSCLVEQCDICGNEIAFDHSQKGAHCTQGHSFSRCSLSLIAIQEPNISKYCSQCGKQFLDCAKLESNGGPSLTQSLFYEFDVCIYCQGKFRG